MHKKTYKKHENEMKKKTKTKEEQNTNKINPLDIHTNIEEDSPAK